MVLYTDAGALSTMVSTVNMKRPWQYFLGSLLPCHIPSWERPSLISTIRMKRSRRHFTGCCYPDPSWGNTHTNRKRSSQTVVTAVEAVDFFLLRLEQFVSYPTFDYLFELLELKFSSRVLRVLGAGLLLGSQRLAWPERGLRSMPDTFFSRPGLGQNFRSIPGLWEKFSSGFAPAHRSVGLHRSRIASQAH